MPLAADLHIETAFRHGRTIVSQSFCSQPFKIVDTTEDKQRTDLQLMLMNASPGILDDDRYDMSITVTEGCALTMETQSYQRIFRMKRGATQKLVVRLKRNSRFAFLPHPLVLHQRAIFRSRATIHLEEGCRLLWGEVISCGRKLNGEIFQFSLYHGLTEIFWNERLVVKENLVLQPGETNLVAIGQWEGFTHQSTLLFIDEQINVQRCIDLVVQTLNDRPGLSFGASALPVNGIIVRMLGYKAEELFGLQQQLGLLLQTATIESPEKLESHVA